MITVTRQDCRITIEGHAGCGPPGQDIVCAAVSTLVQTLARSIDNLTTDTVTADIFSGLAVLRFGDISADARLLVDSFFVGIQGIASAAPDRVQIINQTARNASGQTQRDGAQKENAL